VFPWVSYFNHSCIPNLRRYQGDDYGTLEVRAIRDIEAGEELCISYTDLHMTTADRRSVLKDYFGFTCMCQRCTDTTDASDRFIEVRSCPSRFCQELLLPLKEHDCQVLHCRHCGIINAKHRPK
jgi:SET and MYND domain-containing protein